MSPARPLRLVASVALGTVAAALLAVPAANAASTAQIGRYVALGDSYTAGPKIPNQHGNPSGCARSDHNYPTLLANSLHVKTFVDVSCSGAKTANMANPQSTAGGTNAPQLNALTADTDLVTLTIGGNDLGFTSIFSDCAKMSAGKPLGSPCKKKYTKGGKDQLRARIADTAPKVAEVLKAIRQRAPHARIELISYLKILPGKTGCWPAVPISTGDVPYLDGVEAALNDMLKDQAARNQVGFLDAYNPSRGHDACQFNNNKRWVEGIVPILPAAVLHPNVHGMTAVADLLKKVVG